MKEFVFDLQRFADNGKDLYTGFDSEEKKNIQNSSLLHLRMLSMIFNSPLIKPLLDKDNAQIDFFQSM